MDTHYGQHAGPASATPAAASFIRAQQRVLDRYGVRARRRVVAVPALGGDAQVLEAGEGPPLVLVIGGAVPAAIWVPLMAVLPDRRLHAIELPGFGLADPVAYHHATIRRTAVDHLTGVLDGLGLDRAPFVTQSMGSQWTAWLAAEQPDRVACQVMVGCPAFFLDTSAVLPFRLLSVPGLGSLLLSLQRPTRRGVEQVVRTVGEDPAGLDELCGVLLAAQRMPSYARSLRTLMRASMRWTRPRPEVVTTADQLRRIRHPVRLVWGEQDGFGRPEAGRRMAELLPDADFHLVPGGHAPWFHHADRVGSLVRDFLDSRP